MFVAISFLQLGSWEKKKKLLNWEKNILFLDWE